MPSPCAAETAIGSPSPSAWNSCASGDVARRVDLVRGERRPGRRRGAGCPRSPGRPAAAPARASTTNSATCGVGERRARLVLDRDGERVLVVEVDAAGVDQRERAPVPLGLELLAVARDPGPLVHDRLARLREPVDERRLADVRVADDRDLHASTSRCLDDERDDLLDHPLEVDAGGVDRDGVVGGHERRVLALAVARVALALLGEHRGEVRAELVGAAPRALLGRGGEEHLDRRVRADDRADVAPLGDPVAAVGEQLALLGTSAARTPGSALTCEAAADTAGVRIASVTSRPSSSTRSPSSIVASRAAAAASVAPSLTSSATHRYIAPESR